MFALRVTYLTGRVYSAVFEDGDAKVEPEWPPQPSRLFSALTAAWGDSGAEAELRPALEWLEAQPPPSILFGAHTERRLVQAFVPVNDAKTLPEDRPRKGRVFPSASLTDPHVYFVWEASPTDEVRAKLERLVERTSSLGHSSSLISVELADRVEADGLTEWHPGASKGERLRVPYAGRLSELVSRHNRFSESGHRIHRPTAGRTAVYAAREEADMTPAAGMFGDLIILKRVAGPRASLRSTLSITAAFRGAILKYGPQPVPEFLSGHAPGSTPEAPLRSSAPHVAFIPLANVGFTRSTGEVMGVALVLPRQFTREERRACWRASETIERLAMPWGTWEVSLADAEEQRRALLSETWTRPSRVWATATPLVFDRFPKRAYGPEGEDAVRVALGRVGLPSPIEIDLHYNAWTLGVPKASAFAPAPSRSDKPRRYHCHVRVTFAQPVEGPVIAGAGRFYGYGLFRQLAENGGGW